MERNQSIYDEDPRDFELPTRWRSWNYPTRKEYLTVNLSRADLFRAIVLEVRPDDQDPESVDATSRFSKDDLSYIALRVGLFKL
ncbi:hypothetical protein [Halorubrum laminariae]|uniref:Uncharacterized protein n=1 Tax=Halorubrum laminariae TaxID=1433523 RepID=A0ABD6C293_9EURY|nr:hypothetical protein [Halorubrum laminariae]